MPGIVYCGVCSIPPEYCEYGPNAANCKEWLKKNHPDMFEELYSSVASVEKKVKKLALEAEGEDAGSGEGTDDEDGDGDDADGKKAQKRGGKGMPRPKKAAAPGGKKEVVITRKQRGGRKYVTVVVGLKAFDVDMKKAGKMFGTKFACGSSVNGDEITIQGDIAEDLMDYIVDNFPGIGDDDIIIKEDKAKKKADK